MEEKLSLKMGKNAQRKKSLTCNPNSKHFNANIAKRRAKEKAARKARKMNRNK